MKIFSVALLTWCLLSSSVSAQESGDRASYSLNDCLSIALEHNYDVESAKAQYQIQATNLTQSFGAYLPSLHANVGYTRQLNESTTQDFGGHVITLPYTPNSYTMSATANYVLFNGFSREATYHKASRELSAAEENLYRVRQQVSYSVRSQYLAVLKAMQVAKIRRENVELGKKEVERAQALYDAGRTAIATVYSQQSDLGSREMDLVTAENTTNQSKTSLLATMALPPEGRAEFLESSVSSSIDSSVLRAFRTEIGSYGDALSKALQSRADYRAALIHIESAESGVSSARGGYFPSINANGIWSSSSVNTFGENNAYYVGVNLSYPIFDNLNTSSALQLATIQVQQRQIDRALAEQKVRTELQNAFLNLDASEKQVEISARALVASTANYNATKERFAVGAATLLEYQTANNQIINARINQVTAAYSYLDAQFQVRLAMGTLSEK